MKNLQSECQNCIKKWKKKNIHRNLSKKKEKREKMKNWWPSRVTRRKQKKAYKMLVYIVSLTCALHTSCYLFALITETILFISLHLILQRNEMKLFWHAQAQPYKFRQKHNFICFWFYLFLVCLCFFCGHLFVY